MAEAFGVAAGTAQFAALAVKIINVGHGIYEQLRNAPEQIPKWLDDLKALQVIIFDIEGYPELQSDDVASSIERCVDICQKLSETFDDIKFSVDDPLLQKTWKAIVGKTKDAEIRNWFQELEGIKSTLAMKISLENLKHNREIRADIKDLKSPSPESDEDRCLRALFVTDPARDRDDIIDSKGDICTGTCKWILSTKEYLSWNQASSNPLWISAPPGVGKTFMSIYLSRHFESLSCENSDAVAIFFFCDNKKASRNTAVNILRGLISQLILRQQSLVNIILSKWKMQGASLFDGSSLNTLWKFFEAMVEQMEVSTIYCIIDALDECEETSLASLLRKFEEFGRTRSTKMKLICLSRRYPERIPEALTSFLKIELDMIPAGKEDIQLFISQRVSELARKKNIEPQLQQHIEQTFQEKSENTFLWVSFMVQDLENTNVANIEASLKLLPRGLDAVYERILSNIRPFRKDITSKMLNWILVAMRPLRIPELCEAIHVQPTERLAREQVCEALIKSCGHLLQMSRNKEVIWIFEPKESDKLPKNREDLRDSIQHDGSHEGDPNNDEKDYWDVEVTFLHQSAKDYLQNHTCIGSNLGVESIQQVHESVSDRLIKSLCQHIGDLRYPVHKYECDDFPLTAYAVSFWHRHFQELDNVSLLVRQNPRFFGKTSKTRKDLYGYCYGRSDPIPLLHMAGRLGLDNLAKWLLEQGHSKHWFRLKRNIDTRWGHRYETPLYIACHAGNNSTIRLLLEAGADPSAYCQHQLDQALVQPLLTAAMEIAKILPEKKLEERKKRLAEWLRVRALSTPFGHAVLGSSRDVLKSMAATKGGQRWLKKESRRQGKGLLNEAALWGNEDACRFLIQDQGWDVNRGQPICSALESGQLELARRFVSDWHATLPNNWHLVSTVVGHTPVELEKSLQLLIQEWSVDVNATDELGCTIFCKMLPRQHFAASQLDEVLEILLESGFDPASHQYGAHRRSLIHCIAHQLGFAAAVAHTEIIERIMGHTQADTNAVCAQGQTVLHHFLSTVASLPPKELVLPPTFSVDRSWADSLLNYGSPSLTHLLDLGADRHVKDSQGNTAIDIIKLALDRDFGKDSDWAPRSKFYDHRIIYQKVVAKLITTLESYNSVPQNPAKWYKAK